MRKKSDKREAPSLPVKFGPRKAGQDRLARELTNPPGDCNRKSISRCLASITKLRTTKNMEPWHWWLIAALILIIFEIFFSDFLLATLGAACLATAIVAATGVVFIYQLGAFVGASIVALILLRPAMKRWMYRSSDPLRMGSEGLIGRTGIVTNTVAGYENPGRVKIGGEEWRAIAASSEVIAEDQVVEIVSLDSATVIVKPRPD